MPCRIAIVQSETCGKSSRHPRKGQRSQETLSLYVHTPFCLSKCLYCDFNSYPVLEVPWERYLAALLIDLSSYEGSSLAGRPLDTVFFGGGTPSLCPPRYFETFLSKAFALFPPLSDLEVTLECNPGTLTASRLAGYRAAGINRLSIGVQSFQARHLSVLGRIHGPLEALEAVGAAHDAGFENISIDLIFGIPGQSLEEWKKELELVEALPLSHCSIYSLTVEAGTTLAEMVAGGALSLPGEGVVADMYRVTRNVLREKGFSPYEISNYARGAPCRHNLRYWTGCDYLGVGAGAHSYAAASPVFASGKRIPADASPASMGYRWWTFRDPTRYQGVLERGDSPWEGGEALSPQQAATEMILTRMRLASGLDLEAFARQFGMAPSAAMAAHARSASMRTLVDSEGTRVVLTDSGVLLADRIVAELSIAADRFLETGSPGKATPGANTP